jgi:rhodanese-related sulfurtransferase/transcriptional regulator with XRE-family HTH domain
MIHSLAPREAAALIAAGGLDVVDVRDPRDWASGHLPGARSVPLEDLRAEPRTALTRDKILFACARGMRSQSAAKIAESIGMTEVYSLDGGILAWASDGLPVETPPEAAPAAVAAARENADAVAASCGLPEPGLESVVGNKLKELRAARGLSLDVLARLTGLSRTLLGQIELGKTAPSVGMVWKLARAFDVQFSALLATSGPTEANVMRAKLAKRLASQDGRFSSRALFPLGEKPDVEFYELYLAPHSREDAQPHQPGTREHLVVTAGRLELIVDGHQFELGKGDAIVFAADVPHAYVNQDRDECWMHLVMTYGRAP